MQSCVERIEHVPGCDDALVMFGVVQTLDNWRNDVAASAPYCALDSSNTRAPIPGILTAPLANRKIQLSPGNLFRLLNGAGNLRILHRARQALLGTAAPVNLDVVETPF